MARCTIPNICSLVYKTIGSITTVVLFHVAYSISGTSYMHVYTKPTKHIEIIQLYDTFHGHLCIDLWTSARPMVKRNTEPTISGCHRPDDIINAQRYLVATPSPKPHKAPSFTVLSASEPGKNKPAKPRFYLTTAKDSWLPVYQ